MAPPPGTLRVGRYFLALLGLLAVLYALIVFPGERHKPKLGIDLIGGIRVVFTAQTPKGSPAPTSSQMSQARQILEDRINTTGVTGATVVVQGSDQLVVEIPNGTGTDVAKLGKAAILNFRPLIAPMEPINCGTASKSAGTPSGSASATKTGAAKSDSAKTPQDAGQRPLAAPSNTASPTNRASAAPAGSATPTESATPTTPCTADPFAPLVKSDPSLKPLLEPSLANKEVGLNAETCPTPAPPKVGNKAAPCHAFTSLSQVQQQEVLLALSTYKCSAAQDEPDIDYNFYIACDSSNQFAYLLGHVVVPGKHIKSASAQAPSTGGNSVSSEWTVALTLDGTGGDAWNAWTTKYNTGGQTASAPINTGSTTPACGPSATFPCSTWVGFTLDGQVISSPVTEAALDTQTSISGGFTQDSANALAKELNYGKLPISFKAQDYQNVSATLGSTQLKGAFLAGGIGLALVILYSLIYYRGLGLVTIASLLVSAMLTYAMLVILSSQIGFTLDLAGIAGFIVALGITADSFVVFFERIKDEVHEGRSLRVAVPRAWVRARRTILSADTVSFLAAAILYYFASADVKGFAFTLGMSTILDLVVVFLFTHPMVSLLSRSRAFGSKRFTGLDAVRVGGISTGNDDELLPRRRRPSRPARARTSRTGRPVKATQPAEDERGGGVVVLDKDDDAKDDEARDDDAGEGTAQNSGEDLEQASDEPEAEVEQPSQPEPDRPRRRTTPEPGTAAERAAARRARMREQAQRKGEH